MCRYAAMNTHEPGNKGRHDAITYHKQRLPWGNAEVNGSEGVGLMRRAGERSGRSDDEPNRPRPQSAQSWPRCVENKRTAITRALTLFNETDAKVVSKSCKPWR